MEKSQDRTSLRIRAMPKGSWREFNHPPTSNPNRSPLNADKAELNVRVQKTRGGKGGKTVTVITGLQLGQDQARTLLKKLKATCGTGGTIKLDSLELQGDQVSAVIQFLKSEGYSPKKSGG